MLTLQIKRKWYDMILSGVKKEEYRDIKAYYAQRFMGLFTVLHFSEDFAHDKYDASEVREIRFQNGYSKDAPRFVAKCTLTIGKGKEEWGAEPGKDYFILHIQEVKESGR